jgi:hypothetical protein
MPVSTASPRRPDILGGCDVAYRKAACVIEVLCPCDYSNVPAILKRYIYTSVVESYCG